MSEIKHFTDLNVWKRSHALFLALAREVDRFPQKRVAWVLGDQVLRSCGSISGNIAEGFNRSKAKFLSALDIALGEANETENWLYKIRDVGLIVGEVVDQYIAETRIICRMLNSLIGKISSRVE